MKHPEYANEICPICGYYCLGRGGFLCIDKPALCGVEEDKLAQAMAREPLTTSTGKKPKKRKRK